MLQLGATCEAHVQPRLPRTLGGARCTTLYGSRACTAGLFFASRMSAVTYLAWYPAHVSSHRTVSHAAQYPMRHGVIPAGVASQLDFFIDLHAHSTLMNAFCFCNIVDEAPRTIETEVQWFLRAGLAVPCRAVPCLAVPCLALPCLASPFRPRPRAQRSEWSGAATPMLADGPRRRACLPAVIGRRTSCNCSRPTRATSR